MKCSVFIATSVDGYIADEHGGVDWLHLSGNQQADMTGNEDMGFADFLSSIDCMVMGRKCMETIASFNLSAEQWPYGDIKIYVLSNSLATPPKSLADKVEIYSGKLTDLMAKLEQDGFQHAYIDGGTTITSFLEQQLINEITITRVPIILGTGIPLFGKLTNAVKLHTASATVFKNDYIQIKYSVTYD